MYVVCDSHIAGNLFHPKCMSYCFITFILFCIHKISGSHKINWTYTTYVCTIYIVNCTLLHSAFNTLTIAIYMKLSWQNWNCKLVSVSLWFYSSLRLNELHTHKLSINSIHQQNDITRSGEITVALSIITLKYALFVCLFTKFVTIHMSHTTIQFASLIYDIQVRTYIYIPMLFCPYR